MYFLLLIFKLIYYTCHPELVSGSVNYVLMIPLAHSINSDIELCSTRVGAGLPASGGFTSARPTFPQGVPCPPRESSPSTEHTASNSEVKNTSASIKYKNQDFCIFNNHRFNNNKIRVQVQ